MKYKTNCPMIWEGFDSKESTRTVSDTGFGNFESVKAVALVC